jgi:hypothetical protein
MFDIELICPTDKVYYAYGHFVTLNVSIGEVRWPTIFFCRCALQPPPGSRSVSQTYLCYLGGIIF